MMKKPVQVQDYEKDKDEDEGEVILTSLMGVPVRCKAISGMYHVNVLVLVNVHENVGFYSGYVHVAWPRHTRYQPGPVLRQSVDASLVRCCFAT
jgi:hypothetical protein